MKKIFQHLFSATIAKNTNQFKAWVGDLNEMDDLVALQFSTKKLSQILTQTEDQNTLSLQQELDLIIEIETLNQPRLEKFSAQLANVENMNAELENSIFDTCYNYSRQSYIFHLKLIEKIFNTNNALPDENIPALLLGRSLNAAFNMIKWRLFSQTNPPAKVWLQLNVLYRIAAQHMLLNSAVELFDLSPSTTLAAHFVQTWMLGQLAQASMHKYHVEIATRIVTTLLTRAHISSKYTPEQYLFYIDLDKDICAKRMRHSDINDNCRYWDLDELEKQLRVAITVSDRGEIPQILAFSKIDHAIKLNETLRILFEEWKKTGYVRQRRKIARQASSKTARVNAGIVDICNQVHQANQISSGLRLSRDGTTLDERLRAHIALRQSNGLPVNSGTLDTWIITDESPSGLGTRVNKYANILARPNKLIGLIIDDDPSKVVIGMIRSVKPTQASQLRVGIEIISHHPIWVQLRRSNSEELFANTVVELESLSSLDKKPTPTVDGLFSGIYLPMEGGLSESSTMILPKINFLAHCNYNVSIDGSPKLILLGEPIESRDDWVKVSFPFSEFPPNEIQI